MNCRVIDLYEYFNISCDGDRGGKLHTFVLDNSYEINTLRKYPAMLIIPGGGYEFVSFRENEAVALSFLNKQIDAFVLEYSIASQKHYPYQLLEANMSMIYIKENAKELNIDSNKIGVIGFSAGGHLAGLLSNQFDIAKMKSFLNDRFVDTKPALTVYCYPVVTSDIKYAHIGSFKSLVGDNKDMIDDLSIEKLINKDTPKSFVWTTREDLAVNVMNSFLLVEKLAYYNIPYEFHVFGQGGHGLSLGNRSVLKEENISEITKANSEWFQLMINWLELQDFVIKEK